VAALFASNNFHRIFEISAAIATALSGMAIIDTSMFLRITRKRKCCAALKSKQPSFLKERWPIQRISVSRKRGGVRCFGEVKELLINS